VQESVEKVTKTQRKEKAKNRPNTEQKEEIWNRRTQTEQPSRFKRCCNFFASRSVSLHLLHAFFFFVFALFKWIIIHLNSNEVFFLWYFPLLLYNSSELIHLNSTRQLSLNFKLRPFVSSRVTCFGKWTGQTYFF